MLLDYRVYCTIYALLMLAWAATLIPLSKAKPGTPTFRFWMDRSYKWMGLVSASAGGVAFVNFLDWLWS